MWAVTDVAPADVDNLAANMRQGDVDECAALGMSPRKAIADSMTDSESHSLWIDGKLAAIFGVKELVAEERILGRPHGLAWLLSSDVADKKHRSWWLASVAVLSLLTTKWASLRCLVDARYEKARRWLLRLGFIEQGPATYGKHRFLLFYFSRKEN